VFVVEAAAPATPRVSPPPLQFTGRDPGTHPALHICSSTRPAPLLPLRRPLLRLRAKFGARAGGGSVRRRVPADLFRISAHRPLPIFSLLPLLALARSSSSSVSASCVTPAATHSSLTVPIYFSATTVPSAPSTAPNLSYITYLIRSVPGR
jgi:hypothetical protein